MSLHDRLRIALLAIPGSSVERAFWYVALAGFAWLVLHVIFARPLAGRRISAKRPTLAQMSSEALYSFRSLAVYGVVGGLIVFAVVSGWTPMYFRLVQHAPGGGVRYGWTWFFISIALIILIHDAYFYWTHRLMHHPRLFRLFHRTHH